MTSPRENPAKIGVGLLGLGVVGSAVAESILRANAATPTARLSLEGAVVRDVARRRTVKLPEGLLSSDPNSVLRNPDVQIVVEVMGGVDPAFDYISSALRSGKHVVTANKEVLSKRGDELLKLSAETGSRLHYEASVGGGIPILNTLADDLAGNEIRSIRAIINGTTNFILSKMGEEGADFDNVLAEAQQLGYAEADPTADVDAFDATYKISILARLAFQTGSSPDEIYREGIRGVEAKDFAYAQELGYTIKLLAVARRSNGGLLLRVHPAFVPVDVPIGKVGGALNMVEVEGDLVGPLWLQGAGAGANPTASAVLGDVLRIAREISSGGKPDVVTATRTGLPLVPMTEHVCEYYLRLTAEDRAGVLAKVAGVLGETDISIRSVLQMDVDEEAGTADLVIMTHPAREANMQEAAARIRDLDVVVALENLIRVESYPDVP